MGVRDIWKPVITSPLLSLVPMMIVETTNYNNENPLRTPCTTDYGDCGCDNCHGEFEDISNRMDEFADRLFDLGWDRTKAVWAVPQAFGDDTSVLF